MKFSYNLHNLFKFTINTKNKDIRKWFDRENHLFIDKDSKNSDLYIDIRNISFKRDFYEVKDVYINKEDYSLIKKAPANKLSKQKNFIFRFYNILENKPVRIVTNCDNPNYLQHLIIENFMRYRANFKNCALIHGACFGKGNNSHVFFALGGTGKTIATLNLVSKGYEFLSDDLTYISKNGFAYSYQRSLHFNHKTHESLKHLLMRKRISQSKSAWIETLKFFSSIAPENLRLFAQRILTFDLLPTLVEHINIDEVIPDVKYRKKSKIKTVSMIIKTNGKDITVHDNIGYEELAYRAALETHIELLSLGDMWKCFEYASLVQKSNQIFDFYRREIEILKSAFKGKRCFIIEIPQHFSIEDYINKITKIINKK